MRIVINNKGGTIFQLLTKKRLLRTIVRIHRNFSIVISQPTMQKTTENSTEENLSSKTRDLLSKKIPLTWRKSQIIKKEESRNTTRLLKGKHY